jgi:hypothetical protein
MAIKFQLLTLHEIMIREESFLAPTDGSIPLMPQACWNLVRTNPDHPLDSPAAACLSSDDQRVATIALVNQTIQFAGNEYPCLWGHSFFSHPSFRSRGVGGLLMRELLGALKERRMAFAAYGATPMASRLLEILRMVNTGGVPRYILPLRSNPILQRYLPWGQLADFGAWLINGGIRAWLHLLMASLRTSAEAFRLVENGKFGNCSAPIRLVGDECRARWKRSELLLNWKVSHARAFSKGDYKVFNLVGEDGSQLAYFIIRMAAHEEVGRSKFQNVYICRVLDIGFMTRSVGLVPAILYFLIKIASELGCDVLEIIDTNINIRKYCRKFLFRQSGGYYLIISKLEEYPDKLFDINNWAISMIESEPAFS